MEVSEGFLKWAARLQGTALTPRDRVFYLGHSGFDQVAGNRGQWSNLSGCLEGKRMSTYVGSFGHSYELGLIAVVAAYFDTRRTDWLSCL